MCHFRVYVASVHPDLSETDLKSVFEAFGEVVKCQLARSPSGRGHRGFGYIEFNNLNSQSEAIAGMNMFDLGGQFLRVRLLANVCAFFMLFSSFSAFKMIILYNCDIFQKSSSFLTRYCL